MKSYRVIKGPAQFGPGQSLQLSSAQVALRAHNLDAGETDPVTKRVPVVSKVAIEFKAGEVIWVPEIGRSFQQVLEAVDEPKIGDDKPTAPPAAAASSAAPAPATGKRPTAK